MSSLGPDARESVLPKWAQRRLHALRHQLEQERRAHQKTRLASAITAPGRDWFTVPGPTVNGPVPHRRLFYLYHDGAYAVCDLYPGDLLLVGRNRADLVHDHH